MTSNKSHFKVVGKPINRWMPGILLDTVLFRKVEYAREENAALASRLQFPHAANGYGTSGKFTAVIAASAYLLYKLEKPRATPVDTPALRRQTNL